MKVRFNLNFNRGSTRTIDLSWALIAVTFIVSALLLALTIRGFRGNPSIAELNTPYWTTEGPFELSPERGRMALLYSIVEHKSFIFPIDVAKFAIPDLGYVDGNYVSLFAPGLSFVAIPGYILGKYLGASQVGAFAIVAILALLNAGLIYKISKQLNLHTAASLLGAIIFLFGTPAFSYAVTIYQHHLSTFLILAAIYLLIKYNNFLALSIIWILCGLSISVDYPNFFMMLPIGIAALGKMYFVKNENDVLNISLKTFNIMSIVAIIIPLIFFFWFNTQTYGDPLKLAGSATQVKGIDENGQPSATNFTVGLKDSVTNLSQTAKESKDTVRNPVTFFKTRNILNGFYILFISPDRGVLYFAPVILLGIWGLIRMYKDQNHNVVLLVSVLLMNVILYAMWGDPWGGWAFGARYLIPSYSILAIFIAYLLSQKRNIIAIVLTTVLFAYSSYINTAGALTTNAIPPKVEVLELERLSGVEQKYNYKRNLDFIKNNSSKSFVYNHFMSRKMSVQKYFHIVFGMIIAIYLLLCINLLIKNEKSI